MSTTLRTSKLIQICTQSINYDSQVQSASASLDPQMYEIIDDTGEVIMIPNIMGLTDPNLVDTLAWQFHVDFYDPRKDLEFKKRLVQMSIIWHKTKGTVALVQEVIDTYFPGGATLEEWFEYKVPLPVGAPDPVPGGQPGAWHDRYRFRLSVDQAVIPPADEIAALKLIERYKPVSRWCEDLVYARVSDCNIGWCGMLLRFIYRESAAPADYWISAYTLTGPTSGFVGQPSANFHVTAIGIVPDTPVIITPVAQGGGTFTPAFLSLTRAAPAGSFTYTPASTGPKQISTTNDSGLTNPASLIYTSRARPRT